MNRLTGDNLLVERPAFASHTATHRVFFWVWLLLGLVAAGTIVMELLAGIFYYGVLASFSYAITEGTGLPSGVVINFIGPALMESRIYFLMVMGAISLLLLICSYYCSRLIKRGRYIALLETDRAQPQEGGGGPDSETSA